MAFGSHKNLLTLSSMASYKHVQVRLDFLPQLHLESHVLQEWISFVLFSHLFLKKEKPIRKSWFSPIWLYILNAMSNCRMTSMNWNQGLISLLGRGMWTANTMLLASIFLAMASSKVRILSHWFGPQGMNHFVSCRCLTVSTHLVAK